MFAIPAGIYVAVAILFVFLASGEVQDFDKKEYKKKYCFLYWQYQANFHGSCLLLHQYSFNSYLRLS